METTHIPQIAYTNKTKPVNLWRERQENAATAQDTFLILADMASQAAKFHGKKQFDLDTKSFHFSLEVPGKPNTKYGSFKGCTYHVYRDSEFTPCVVFFMFPTNTLFLPTLLRALADVKKLIGTTQLVVFSEWEEKRSEVPVFKELNINCEVELTQTVVVTDKETGIKTTKTAKLTEKRNWSQLVHEAKMDIIRTRNLMGNRVEEKTLYPNPHLKNIQPTDRSTQDKIRSIVQTYTEK